MKILLAEDDKSISTISKMALEQLGHHQVDLAIDGKMALEMIRSTQYDLILMDHMMPKMNGLSVYQEYQRDPQATTPVIFFSAKSTGEDVETLRRSGLGFIPKPFDPTLLCQKIEELLQNTKGSINP